MNHKNRIYVLDLTFVLWDTKLDESKTSCSEFDISTKDMHKLRPQQATHDGSPGPARLADRALQVVASKSLTRMPVDNTGYVLWRRRVAVTIDPGDDEGPAEFWRGWPALYCIFIRVYWFVLVQHSSKFAKYKILYSFVLTCMLLYKHVHVYAL